MFPTGPSSWQLRRLDASDWVGLYTFTEEPQHASDIAMANHYTATHPSSPFVGQVVVMRKDEQELRRLVGRKLTVVRVGGPSEEQLLPEGQFVTTLLEEFALPLSSEEVAKLASLESRQGP